ncbi:MAG: hypothetical protein ABEK00_02090, partial [Candidatus Nanohaloarchaea archaeon]
MRIQTLGTVLFLTLVLMTGSATAYVNEGGATCGGDDGQCKCSGLSISIQQPSSGATGLSNPVHVEADITKDNNVGPIWDVKYNVDGGSNITVTSTWFSSSQNPEVQGDISSTLSTGTHDLFIYTDTQNCYATDTVTFSVGNPTTTSGPTCYNSVDDDGHGGFDFTDANPGACVRPEDKAYVSQSYLDQIEGDIWDTDLSKTMGGTPSSGSISLQFSEKVFQNAAGNSGEEKSDTSGSGTITERYVSVSNSEGNNWAFGKLKSSSASIPSGAVDQGGRIVFGPNPINSDSCGDSVRQSSEESGNVKGDTAGTDVSTPCRADFGRQWEKYDVSDPFNDKGTTGMQCRDDQVSCNNADVSCTDGDSTYPGCGSCSSSVVTTADCDYTAGTTGTESDSGGFEQDTGNYFWQTSGDDAYKMKCTED